MTVFVSYARQDEAAVVQLCADLQRLGRDVWYDKHIAPAERWWQEILDEIRRCDLFVVAVSTSWRDSRPCQSELEYALQLHRPLLPVLVGQVEMETIRSEVAETNYCDFTTDDDHASALDLALALDRAPPAETLPQPLPTPPPAPTNNVAHLTELLDRPNLTLAEQRSLLDELLGLLNAGETRAVAVEHLDRLRGRSDVVAAIAAEIERSITALGPLAERSRGLVSNFPRLQSLQLSIDEGTCTPVLGPGLTDSLIGPRRGLAKEWAKLFGFPMAPYQIHDLPQVAQFVKVQNDVPTLRSALSGYLREKLMRDYPDVVREDLGLGHLDEMLTLAWRHRVGLDGAAETATAEPHMALARLPIRLYITAQPSNLLAHALEAVDKKPVVEFCRWRAADWPKPILKSRDPYEPSIDKPMIFHLFGNLNYPDSLVLTEDDYFDFLINVTRNRTKLIPPCVLTALSRSALMFLGFGVEQWEFRVLLRSLVSPEAGRQPYSHVAAQFNLAESVMSPEAARRYLEKYFAQFNQMTIDICWASVDEFLEMFARSSEPAA